MNRPLLRAVRILSVLLVLTGCSHEPKATSLESASDAFNELRAEVREEIKDPARAAEVAVLVGQMEQLMIEAAEARKTHQVRLRALTRDYDAPEEDFRAAFREFNGKKISRQDRFFLIDQRARSLTTDKEWKAIVKVRIRAFKAAAVAEQGI